MSILQKAPLSLFVATLAACGGGGGGGDSTPPPPVAIVVSLAEVSGESVAAEISGTIAKFQISRTGPGTAVSVNFTMSGNPEAVKGSADATDFELHYSDGGMVSGSVLALGANQNSRVIEVRPVLDTQHEVPEVALFSLSTGSGYNLGSNTTASISVIDAENTPANRKVFLGLFGPQGSAVTTAS
jgi:hypothetical protein